MWTRRQVLAATAVAPLSFARPVSAADPTQIFSESESSKDSRLNAAKTLNDYFPFKVPENLEEWNKRRTELQHQIRVATGLWPYPERTPLNAVIHTPVQRKGYTIEKVIFSSLPGHYVTGNLYRPTGEGKTPRPAILSPHGHWNNGRFFTANDAEVKKQLESKAESMRNGALHPLQARCAMLAKLGYVVLHYDMVGYADSTKLEHRRGFADADAELRSHNMMGLQTWNSIRALDFLESLPDVDKKRIGVTGASGGGTQTFILCALDDRPAVAFPAVMVSAQMQGGCVCENCSGLRVNTGNVELAALFAPKPMAMSCADDWTKQFLKDGYGLPELKRLWGLYGKPELVEAKAWLQYGHNYNSHSREFMYSWFQKHLQGKDEEVKEMDYEPLTIKELSVFDERHPRPKDELNAEALRKTLIERDEKWLQELRSGSDAKAVARFREILFPALKAMINSELPDKIAIRKGPLESKHEGFVMHRAVLGRIDETDAVPCAGIYNPKTAEPKLIIWAHPKGKSSLLQDGKLTPIAKKLTDAGYSIVAPDLLGIGEQKHKTPFKVDQSFAGYTFGYNRSLLAQRVHDLLTLVTFGKRILQSQSIQLVGWNEAGPWTILAKALAGDSVAKTAADMNKFSFNSIRETSDPMMLPGAIKFGGMSSFQALCAPGELLVHNEEATDEFLKACYSTAGATKRLTRSRDRWSDEKVADWLIG